METTAMPKTLSASTIIGTEVVNAQGEDLGSVKEVMLDVRSGKVAYAALSFGGFLGMGDKLFALPWEAFSVDNDEERLILNVDKEKLEQAPGFDQDNWPSSDDHDYLTGVYSHYGYEPYWK